MADLAKELMRDKGVKFGNAWELNAPALEGLFDRVENYQKGAKAEAVPDVTDMRDIYGVIMYRLGHPNAVRLRRILEWLFTPLEMEICHVLKDVEYDDDQIANMAKIFDMPAEQITDILDNLMQKGVVFPRSYRIKGRYRFLPRGLYQFHDVSMSNTGVDMKYGPQLFNLWNEFFLHEDGEAMAAMHKNHWKRNQEEGVGMGRVLPAYEAILEGPDADQIQPWEDARAIIDAQEVIALAPCSCRRRVSGGGMTCKRTKHQVCLNFNKAAEGVIVRNGREISKEEALGVVRQANRDGLIHSYSGTQVIKGTLLCACCDCCCHHWAGLWQYGFTPQYRWDKSRWEVSIEAGACDACESTVGGPKCIDICQFDAIEMKEQEGYTEPQREDIAAIVQHPKKVQRYKAYVDINKCWGCLSCALVCEPKAITAHCARPVEWVPKYDNTAAPSLRRTEGVRLVQDWD